MAKLDSKGRNARIAGMAILTTCFLVGWIITAAFRGLYTLARIWPGGVAVILGAAAVFAIGSQAGH
jgi:hypothetical protein